MRSSESTVPREYCGERIDKYLAMRFGYMSRNEWQREISSGQITVNGDMVSSHHRKIREGDIVTYEGRDLVEPEIDPNYTIIYEDRHFLGINKPGNLPVHPSGIFYHNTLLTLLQNETGMKLHPLHRLDRETSGAILFSKDRETASIIQSGFNDLVSKTYIAIVHGRLASAMRVDVPLGQDHTSAVRKKRGAYHGAPEKAATSFIPLLTAGEYTLVRAVPETGRQHQIRAHCLHAGFPILGDKLYGLDETLYIKFAQEGYSEEIEQKLGFHRTALHSRRIIFSHPVTKKTVRITAPTPDDFKLFLEGTWPGR